MSKQRSYEQYCALAKALDVLGERWTLLLVRELLRGPKRFTDLLEGSPGIATDMLAARLRTLEEADVIVRRTLPRPAASTVYELTEAGRELEPVLHELARWGLRLLGRKYGETFRIAWLDFPLRMMFHAEAATRSEPLIVQFETGGEAMHARIASGKLETFATPADAPHVVVAGDISTLAGAMRDPAFAVEARHAGKLRIEGERDSVRYAADVFGWRKPAPTEPSRTDRRAIRRTEPTRSRSSRPR